MPAWRILSAQRGHGVFADLNAILRFAQRQTDAPAWANKSPAHGTAAPITAQTSLGTKPTAANYPTRSLGWHFSTDTFAAYALIVGAAV